MQRENFHSASLDLDLALASRVFGLSWIPRMKEITDPTAPQRMHHSTNPVPEC